MQPNEANGGVRVYEYGQKVKIRFVSPVSPARGGGAIPTAICETS